MSTEAPRPVPRKGILDIAAYVPGKSKAPNGVELHKLSANENPLGPSPKVREALARLGETLELYPDGQSGVLREAIAEAYGLNVRNIVCGNGSGELLQFLCAAFLSDGSEAIHTEHAFSIYEIYTRANGAVPVVVPETGLRADVDAILKAVTPRTRIVFLANPNNPTGSYLPFDAVRRLHAGLPKNVLLVLDAAYAEYVRRNDYEAGLELVSANANVVMTRTLSKIHGLAALRIGWMYAPEDVVDAVNRIRPPFNINAAAMAAGAAAIGDRAHVAKAVEHNERWLEWVTTELSALGLAVAPSVANFVLIHFPSEPGRGAAEAEAFLTARGFILRGVSSYGLPNALRMTIGSEDANRGAVAALKDFLRS